MLFYWDPTILLMIPAIIIAGWAQLRISGDFKKYAQVYASRGYSSQDVCMMILRDNGISDVGIQPIGGSLTDHYDPRSRTIGLSQSTYGSRSVAAIAVAAHETGHAVQDSEDYAPLRIRNSMVPVVNFGSALAFPLILIGIVFNYGILAQIALAVFFVIFLFQCVTLPVEFNASKRALASLENDGILTADELSGAKRVLTSAALTYVAAMITSLLQFLRLFLLSNRRR